MIKYYAARNHPLAKGFENLSCGEILVKAKRRITVLNLGYTLRGLAKTPTNISDGELWSKSQLVKAVSYCLKSFHFRCLLGSWLHLQ